MARQLSTDSDYDGRIPSWAAPVGTNEERSVDRLSRRRSLACSDIDVEIIGTRTDGHTYFIIEVTSVIKKWSLARRFSDFLFVDRQLHKNYPRLQLPKLPPKRFLGSSTDAKVVEERREQLETYLKAVVSIPQVWTRNDLALFLDNETNSMMFIWNFERMRRLQDMLSSMTEQNNETAKLNSDLESARHEVLALQSRLSQMEMIFLQQAAGVASEKLPNDLIRSMSGANIASGNLLSAQLKSELTNEHLALYEEPLDVGDDLAVKVTDDDEIIRTDDPDTSSPRDRTMTTEEVLKVIDLVHKENIAGDDVDAGEDSRAFAASVELQEAMRMSNVLLPEKYDIFIRSKDSPARESIERFESPPPAHAISPSREGPQVLQSERELLKFKFGEDETSSWKLELCANVDKAIDCLMPSTESIELRMRVFSFLRDMICANLGSQLFPTGSFISNTYLPDSDLDTTCLVLRNDDDSWFVRVNECLCMSSFNSNLPYGADSIVSSKHSSFDTIPEAADYKPAAVSRVSVTNVSFVNSDSKKIRSTINGVIVDISANQVSAIYTQYFTEAIDNYVGRDYLFKRSLLLLKAWSRYESIRYTDNKGSISESRDSKLNSWALTVMLVWIFNCHGDTITHPIQALGRFLRYYTSFDFRQYAITAIGPVNAEDLSQLSDEKAAELRLPRYLFFPEDLIRNCNARYQETLSMSKVSFHDPSDPQLTNSASDHQGSETVAMDGVVSSASMPLSSFAGPVAPAAAASSIAPQKYNSAWILRGAFPEISHEYQRGFVNVIDPLANYNITRALENSDYDSIVDSFGHGYSAFQAMCEEQMQKDESNDSSALASFLQNTYQKINLLPRKTSISMTSRTLLAPQKTDLEFALQYSEFVFGARIDAELLVTLIVQILGQKGPMPVGEIGKNLQLITACPQLSKRLKDQFGGLKKAVEMADSTKIRISTDHPFNPSVHLAENNSSVDDSASSPFAFKHSEYVYNPVNALNVLAKASDSSSVNTKEKRGTGGRRHYDTPDGMSTTSGISARTMKSGYGNHAPMALEIPYGNEYIQGLQRRRGKSMGGSGHNSANNSPRRLNYGGNQGGYYPNFGDRGGGNVSPYQESFIPMNQGAPPIHPGYIQQQNYMHYIAQQQVYQQMQAMQYHASQASSYGSNYSGHQSPMAQSPINPSYMNQPMGYYAPPMVGGLPHVPMAMNMPRPYGTESSSADHVSQGADDSSSPVAHQSGDNE